MGLVEEMAFLCLFVCLRVVCLLVEFLIKVTEVDVPEQQQRTGQSLFLFFCNQATARRFLAFLFAHCVRCVRCV